MLDLFLPVLCTSSEIYMPSRYVKPPLTGVPVAGAKAGSNASMSTLRWIGLCLLQEENQTLLCRSDLWQ